MLFKANESPVCILMVIIIFKRSKRILKYYVKENTMHTPFAFKRAASLILKPLQSVSYSMLSQTVIFTRTQFYTS